MNPSSSKAQKMSSAGLNVGTWMPVEDDRLKEAVGKHGPRWVAVATEVGTRNGDQCAKRWNENLNPELDHGSWSLVEVFMLHPNGHFLVKSSVANGCRDTRISYCCIS
jgi:hypothetical protein